jgi:hypothetical protein
MATFTSTSTADTPRSERDRLFVVDSSTTVTSPYYVRETTVSVPAYTYSPALDE